jgi:hypothetical protein
MVWLSQWLAILIPQLVDGAQAEARVVGGGRVRAHQFKGAFTEGRKLPIR